MTFHLPDLLGKTENDPLVQQFISHYRLVDYDETEDARSFWQQNNPGESYEAHNAEIRALLGRISVSYVEPVNWSVQLPIEMEGPDTPLRVREVTVRAGFPDALPYGLRQDVDLGEFSIGRLVSKKRIDGSVLKYFLYEDLEIQLCHAVSDGCLEMLSLRPVDPGCLAQLRFHDGLKAQKNHIVASVDDKIEGWRQESPVRLWRQRKAEGDDIFTDENLALAQAEIDTFIEAIRQAITKKLPTQIVNALKRAIKQFNRLNRKHGDFIETSEREELVPYLQNIVAATGLKWEQGFDITLEWREW